MLLSGHTRALLSGFKLMTEDPMAPVRRNEPGIAYGAFTGTASRAPDVDTKDVHRIVVLVVCTISFLGFLVLLFFA